MFDAAIKERICTNFKCNMHDVFEEDRNRYMFEVSFPGSEYKLHGFKPKYSDVWEVAVMKGDFVDTTTPLTSDVITNVEDDEVYSLVKQLHNFISNGI